MQSNRLLQPTSATPTIEDEVLLTSGQLREMLGRVSDMALWRWQHNASLNFPAPIRINRRNYWRRGAIRRWLASRPGGEVV